MAKTSGSVRGISGKMSQLAKDAVDYYVSGNGYDLNYALRNLQNIEGEDFLLMQGLDEATKKGLSKDYILYRGMSAEALFGKDVEYGLLKSGLVLGYQDRDVNIAVEKYTKIAKSKVYVDRGYASTSIRSSVAEGFGREQNVVVRFRVPRGTRGIDLSANRSIYKNNTNEQEVLLARNLKYRVERVYGYNGKIYADAKII